MSALELYNMHTTEETLEEVKRSGLDKQTFLENLSLSRDHLFTRQIRKIGPLEFSQVLDSSGTFHENITFTPKVRFRRGRDVFLAGDGYSVNMSRFFRDVESAAKLWEDDDSSDRKFIRGFLWAVVFAIPLWILIGAGLYALLKR